MKAKLGMVVLAVAVMVAGCDSDEESPAEGDQEAQQEEETAPEEELAPLEGPFEGAHDASREVDAADFGEKFIDSVCLAYDNCRNEELKSVAFRTILTSATMNAPEFSTDEQRQAFDQRVLELNESQELVPDHEACIDVFGPMLLQGGLDGESLANSVEAGSVEYDAERAGECLAQFGEPFEVCREQTEVGDEPPNVEHVMGTMRSHQEDTSSHFEACGEMFSGTRSEGDECEFNYECVDGLACETDPEQDVDRCVEPAGIEGGMGPGAPGGGPQPGPGGGQPPGPGF